MNFPSKKNAVIVGGGPAGLGAALILAKRGWNNITVLEKRTSADYYEPDKSFSYQIDGRGQKLIDLLGLTDKLSELGVSSREFYFTLIKKNGTRKTSKLPVADSTRTPAYWLDRASFVQLLYQEIEDSWQESIQVLFQTQCVKIEQKRSQQGVNSLEIVAQSAEDRHFTLTPTLIVGCDGLNSIVRQTLHQWEEGKADNFKMQLFPSPSAGLKYKVLVLPAQFPLSPDKKDLAESTMAYGIRSAFKKRDRAIFLGLLPIKNPNRPRTANIITYPDHQIWQLKTPETLSNFFKQAFPQLPLEQIIVPEELARFSASRGGEFPSPQYCSGLSKIWQEPKDNQGTAVVLFGDAVHCFPPDIGQGVNSALEDVYLFHQALVEAENNPFQAVSDYEKLRQPDIKALIRLVQISYPWQYNQNPLRKRLWSLNFSLRLLLNRLFPFLFSSHSFLLIQQHELSYSEILAKSNRTSQNIVILTVLTVIALISIAGTFQI